jgi:hypothetical protein
MKLAPSRNCYADFRCGLDADFFAGVSLGFSYRHQHSFWPLALRGFSAGFAGDDAYTRG